MGIEEIKIVLLGVGSGEVGTMVTFIDPVLREGDERTKRIQEAAIEIYGKGPFKIEKITKDVAADEYMVHMDIPRDRIIIMPAKSLIEV